MGVVGAALRGFGKALKKGKGIRSKTTPDKSKLDLAQSKLNIAKAKGKSIDKMAKDGKLPIDFDYRYQKMALKEKNTGKDAFPITYFGSTNQFQIESDIHIAIYLNIYNIDSGTDNLKKYFTLIECAILYADIIDVDNKNLNKLRKYYNINDKNYLGIIKTDLYDIGILRNTN